MKVSLILKGAADFYGRVPVYIRWSEGQTRTFKKTTLRITNDQFDRFKKHTHLPKEKELYTRFLNAMDLQQTKEVDFFTYTNACIREWEKEKRSETIRQHKSEVSKLYQFETKLNLSGITPDFLREYKAYCYAKGNQGNTVWKSFKFIRLITRRAYKEKL
ncbi:MAG: phage integrase SAM-like domain-containing protein, partial [Bacteroidota bacterium]